jgi:hypothetical protein
MDSGADASPTPNSPAAKIFLDIEEFLRGQRDSNRPDPVGLDLPALDRRTLPASGKLMGRSTSRSHSAGGDAEPGPSRAPASVAMLSLSPAAFAPSRSAPGRAGAALL